MSDTINAPVAIKDMADQARFRETVFKAVWLIAHELQSNGGYLSLDEGRFNALENIGPLVSLSIKGGQVIIEATQTMEASNGEEGTACKICGARRQDNPEHGGKK